MSFQRNTYVFLILIILCGLILLIVNIFQSRPGGREVDYSLSGQECRGQLKEDTTFVENNFSSLSQYDERLISYVRARYLIPPSTKPYNLNKRPKETEHSSWVKTYFKDKKNGIFIEAGANEGEFHSHTLTLEHDLGWTGLLIECNPTVVPYLRSKRRKAWVAGVCISMGEHPSVLNFSNPEKWTYSGRLGPAWNLPVPTNWTYFDVEAVPLYSVIMAAGFKEIDYFSFDVEGIEFDILRTFPFDKILIKLMIVEVYFLPQAKRDELEGFMTSKGYTCIKKMDLDHIYAHNSQLNQITNYKFK